jgi:phosphoribosylformimino-5-aminoimidazole carboxamide ribotide isomerase
MRIVPVIDLMRGQAVHAKRGLRAEYQPLQSPLCRNAEPVAVLEGLLGLYPFDTVYLADLDALMGGPHQTARIEALRRAFPAISFWIDSGLPAWQGASVEGIARFRTVIGSESLNDELTALREAGSGPFILSLDFREGGLAGPKALLDQPERWPEQVILMSLARVGSGEGPDFARLEAFVEQHPRHRFTAAGGVRDYGDLERLQAIGATEALVASALHAGRLDRRTLERFSGKQ